MTNAPTNHLVAVLACAAGELTQSETARQLGLFPSVISKYKKHYEIAFVYRGRGRRASPPSERAKLMRALYQEGYTLQQIGDQYGITRERVRQILTKHFGIRADGGGNHVRAVRKKEKRRQAKEAACLKKHGCTLAQFRSLLAVGREEQKNGKPKYRTAIYAFRQQRQSAKRRGIGWQLTLWQWWTVWQESGHWSQRGRGQGYVMSRVGDVGPYALGNIFIQPAIHNNSETRLKQSNLPIGVSRKKDKYAAHRHIGGKKIYLGVFPTPELAHAAYLSVAA